MHVKDYEQLITATQSIMVLSLEHLAGLIRDEAYDQDDAADALDVAFEGDKIPTFELTEVLAVRLVRQATDEVLERLEELASEERPE